MKQVFAEIFVLTSFQVIHAAFFSQQDVYIMFLRQHKKAFEDQQFALKKCKKMRHHRMPSYLPALRLWMCGHALMGVLVG